MPVSARAKVEVSEEVKAQFVEVYNVVMEEFRNEIKQSDVDVSVTARFGKVIFWNLPKEMVSKPFSVSELENAMWMREVSYTFETSSPPTDAEYVHIVAEELKGAESTTRITVISVRCHHKNVSNCK